LLAFVEENSGYRVFIVNRVELMYINLTTCMLVLVINNSVNNLLESLVGEGKGKRGGSDLICKS